MQARDVPFFSIIIAVRNAAPTIDACLQSVFAQQDCSFEVIVIDALSSDGTAEILRRYSAQLADYVSERDAGIADAWNKGVRRARGSWLYFLGADDFLFDSTVLRDVARVLRDLPAEVLLAYGRVRMLDAIAGDVLVGGPWDKARKSMRYMMRIPHQGVFHHRDLFTRFGYFDVNLRIAADYEMLLRCIKSSPPTFIENTVVASCAVGGISTTYAARAQAFEEFRVAAQRHFSGDVPLVWHWQHRKAKILAWTARVGLQPVVTAVTKLKRSMRKK